MSNLVEMAAVNVNHRPVSVVESSNIPQINLPSVSPDLSRSTSFQPNPGHDPSSHVGSNTPAADGLVGINKSQDGYLKKPQFVARDGAVGGNSHNETNVE